MKRLRLYILLAILVSSAFLFNGATNAAENEVTVTYAVPYEFIQYSYYSGLTYADSIWMDAVYASLFKRSVDSGSHYVPELAASMPTTTDGVTWTVTISPNAKFSSGNPVTADDVVFSYTVSLNSAINKQSYSTISSYLSTANIVKIDNSTVEFTFTSTPFSHLEILSEPIIEKAYFQAKYDACVSGGSCDWNNPDGSDAVSAGPFMVNNLSRTKVELVKNPYYLMPVIADRVTIITYLDVNLALSDLDNGLLDIVDKVYGIVPSTYFFDNVVFRYQVQNTHQEISLNHQSPYYGTGLMTPRGMANASEAPAAALAVRRAMSAIANRYLYVSDYMSGNGFPAASPASPTSLYFDSSIKVDQFNISRAKEYMMMAGYNFSTLSDLNSDGIYETFFFNITVLAPNTSPMRNQWSNDWQSQLSKIGIGVTSFENVGWDIIVPRTFGYTNSTASGTYPVPLWDNGGYDVLFVGYSWGLEWDPSGLYENYSFVPNGFNFYNYVNLTTQTLIEQYVSENNLTNKALLASKVQKALHDDLPVIPLVHSASYWAVHSNLTQFDQFVLKDGAFEWDKVVGANVNSVTKTDTTPTTTTNSTSVTNTSVTNTTATLPTTNSSTTVPITSSTTEATLPITSTTTSEDTTEDSSTTKDNSVPLSDFAIYIAMSFVGIMAIVRRRSGGKN